MGGVEHLNLQLKLYSNIHGRARAGWCLCLQFLADIFFMWCSWTDTEVVHEEYEDFVDLC
jgi:hypothetical protein